MMNNDIFNYIISLIIDNADDAKADVAANPNNEFKEGRLLAYYEVLDTIRNQLEIYEYNLEECSLEEDPIKLFSRAKENKDIL